MWIQPSEGDTWSLPQTCGVCPEYSRNIRGFSGFVWSPTTFPFFFLGSHFLVWVPPLCGYLLTYSLGWKQRKTLLNVFYDSVMILCWSFVLIPQHCDEELQLCVLVPCVLITKLAHFTLFLFFTLSYILFLSKAQLALFLCEEIFQALAAAVNHRITPQVILLFIFILFCWTFAEFLSCSSIASINSNKCYGVTELRCSAVTWRSRGLFSKKKWFREEKRCWSNFLHPAFAIPPTVHLLSFGHSSGFCVIHPCECRSLLPPGTPQYNHFKLPNTYKWAENLCV